MKIKSLLLFLLAFEFSCSKIAQEKKTDGREIVGTWETRILFVRRMYNSVDGLS